MSYWVAMTDVNEDGKPNSSFENLQICLSLLWRFIIVHGHMDKIAMPILGSGKTGINESREKILKEILFSFVAFSREEKITEELIICIHPNDYFNNLIDIENIKRYLEYLCEYLYDQQPQEVKSKGI